MHTENDERAGLPAGVDFQVIMSTEWRLLEAICAFSNHDGYNVYRSDRFRNYYGGNGIEILDPRGRSLAEWEGIFHGHFEPELFVHTTFIYPMQESCEYLTGQARDADYHAELYSFMFVADTSRCRALPDNLEIRKIETEEDWAMLLEFEGATYVDGDWYDPEYTGPDRLFEKTRFTSEAVGIDWFYIARKGKREILSKLGIFQHNGISRLQDVETARDHQRRGLATYLVGFAIDHAITTLRTHGLAVCADMEYYAFDLYRKLGFQPAGNYVELMKYPIRNPKFLS